MTLALRGTVFLDGERRPDDYEIRYVARPASGLQWP